MIAFKRFLYIILMIAAFGGIFLIYNIHESQPASVQSLDVSVLEREFMGTVQIDQEERPRVWLLGEPGAGKNGEVYTNVRQFCQDLRLTVAGEGRFDPDEVKEQDLVICCAAPVSRYADPAKLEGFIAKGGRVILAAGIGGGGEDVRLWQAFGVKRNLPGGDQRDLTFEKPLLPLQPERAWYDGDSASARLQVSDDASVYIRAGEDKIPILYTHDWKEGRVCLINGTFLADFRCMGLLTGAISALLPDFIYPVLGVKVVFLDDLPVFASADDEICRRMYGYSSEGFFRDVLWPAFQGMSLRTNTPYTSSVLVAAASEEGFVAEDKVTLTDICKSALQFGGELAYAVDCPEDQTAVLDRGLIDWFTRTFTSYTVQGLVSDTNEYPAKLPKLPGADIQIVRGKLESHDQRLSLGKEYAVFPAATRGNSVDDGNLFAICSVLGAYGTVSHVFDADLLITRDGNTAAWNLDRLQIGLFESEVLSRAPWLAGRTLSQTADDVKSYRNMEYGWKKSGRQITLDCSGAVKGQTFFYHADSRIVGAEGLTYEEVGNGYYLLHIQGNHGTITLEEER